MQIKKLFSVAVLLFTGTILFSQNPALLKGVGFSQAFESGSDPCDIYFNYYSKQDFLNVKELGINEVRLPIFLANMVREDGKLSPLFLYLLDRYVDMAEETGVNLILTNMSAYDYADLEGLRSQFLNIWSQMAWHFKDRSELIYYELANEPSNISVEDWGAVQGEVIDTIRTIDQVHTIIVTSANWGSLYNLQDLPEYEDDNLIYVFHFYDPFLFTHQGAASQGFEELTGMPFPYDESRMPPMPSSFIGTWDEGRYNDYPTAATIETIRAQIAVAADFKNTRNVRLLCGEFGADDQYSALDDRATWYETLRTVLEENDISWSMHGYTKYWGLFEYGTDKLFAYDLNVPIVEAMGLTVPEQKEFEMIPDSTALVIYDDYVNRDIDVWISVDDTLSHFYSEEDPEDGKFCIRMKDFPLWCYFDFNFKPNRDFSRLVEEGYSLSFWIKGDSPGARFNVRFFDTDTDDPNDHPWRMVYNIDETLAPWDNEWHLVQIPLADFVEQGAADDGTWYQPEGKFDWAAIDNFQIQTEFEGLEGKTFWFDQVELLKAPEVEKTQVTFRVDMQDQAVTAAGVYLNGSFCDWDPAAAVEMTADGSVYTAVLEFEPGETVEYKFVNGAPDNWAQYEIIAGKSCAFGTDSNRGIVIPETDTILDAVCFAACNACDPSFSGAEPLANILIVPNPTTGRVELKGLAGEEVLVNIFAGDGRLVLSTRLNSSSSGQLDLSGFDQGMYFLRISNDQGLIGMQKVVKL